MTGQTDREREASGEPTRTKAWKQDVLRPGATWLAIAFSAFAVQSVTGSTENNTGGLPSPEQWAGRWDAGIYTTLAQSGYDLDVDAGHQPGWFPGFPLVIRAIHVLVPDWADAAVVSSALGGLAVAILFWHWMGTKGSDAPARASGLLCLLLYPYAIFLLGVPYSDATFLAFLIAAFIAVERDHLVLAGVLCAAASLTRIVGVVGAVGLIITALERQQILVPAEHGRMAKWRLPDRLIWQRLHWRLSALLIGFLGAGGYIAYCWIAFGDAFAYFRINDELIRRAPLLSWNTLLKTDVASLEAIRARWSWDDPLFFVAIYGNLVLTLAVAALVPFVGKRFGWGYGFYTAAVFIIIWTGNPDLGASGRYVLAAFPAFAYLGERLAARPPWVRVACLGTSAVLLMGVAICWDLARPPAGW